MKTSKLKYYQFNLSQEVLELYISDAKKTTNTSIYPTYSSAITQSIIEAIASDNADFDTTDTEMVNTVEKLIKECGMDENGIYTPDAHIAMQKLCIKRGIRPDAIQLHDRTWKTKLKSFLGFGKKKEQPTQDNTSKHKKMFGMTVAGVAGIALLGLSALFGGQKSDTESGSDTNKQKIENKQTTPKKTTPHQTHTVVIKEQVAAAKPLVSKEIQTINNFCDSALDILIGSKKRDTLYNKIQAQVDRGIFRIPVGMSVQRIAHAMEMSRIYEGKSIILDALNSDVKLTEIQQIAFEAHIDGIGVRGEKLQKRMAAKQKLSGHSRFNKASYNQQMKHIKNLKQLRQIRGR